ncbi:MAG: hypothetical protein OEY49_16250 [Candidatus Heimdallarchaeota archaeon]|nr:hypothetical protein [Candidatus Heimdallarchaeota archaeon]
MLLKDKGEEKAKQIIQSLIPETSDQDERLLDKYPGLNWGFKTKFETDDIFEEVRIDTVKNQIHLKKDLIEEVWFLHYLRGLLFFYYRNQNEDVRASWHIYTLFSLLFTPSTIIHVNTKAKLFYKWKEIFEQYHKIDPKYEFPRIYQLLTETSKQQKILLFQEFITMKEMYKSSTLYDILNFTIFTFVPKNYTEMEINVLNYCLNNQSLLTNEIKAKFPKLKNPMLYDILGKLKFFSLVSFIRVNRSLFGLSAMYILNLEEEKARIIKSYPFYQNIEKFEDDNVNFQKFHFPFYQLKELISMVRSNNGLDYNILISIVDEVEINYSPEMYDITNDNWYSVSKVYKNVISIKNNRYKPVNRDNFHRYVLTPKEINFLMEIIGSKTDNLDKIQTTATRLKARNMKQKLEGLGYYKPQIMWRIPIKFPTWVYLLSLSDEKELRPLINEIGNDLDEFQFINVLDDKLSNTLQANRILLELSRKSWPSYSVEYGYSIHDSPNPKIQKVGIIKIAAREEDLDVLNSNSSMNYVGKQRSITGSIFNFPIDLYNDGLWNMDFKMMIKILTN